MKKIFNSFMTHDLDNLVWGILGALAITLLVLYTGDKPTAMSLGGAFIGICLNKMRGKNGVEEVEEPKPTNILGKPK